MQTTSKPTDGATAGAADGLKFTDQYLLLFRGRHWDHGLSDEALRALVDKVNVWMEGLQREGRVLGGQPLAEAGQLVSGEPQRAAVDGPFTESKEVVGGYLLVRAGSLAEAVALTESYPPLAHGITVEVRPVLEECPVFARARARLAVV